MVRDGMVRDGEYSRGSTKTKKREDMRSKCDEESSGGRSKSGKDQGQLGPPIAGDGNSSAPQGSGYHASRDG